MLLLTVSCSYVAVIMLRHRIFVFHISFPSILSALMMGDAYRVIASVVSGRPLKLNRFCNKMDGFVRPADNSRSIWSSLLESRGKVDGCFRINFTESGRGPKRVRYEHAFKADPRVCPLLAGCCGASSAAQRGSDPPSAQSLRSPAGSRSEPWAPPGKGCFKLKTVFGRTRSLRKSTLRTTYRSCATDLAVSQKGTVHRDSAEASAIPLPCRCEDPCRSKNQPKENQENWILRLGPRRANQEHNPRAAGAETRVSSNDSRGRLPAGPGRRALLFLLVGLAARACRPSEFTASLGGRIQTT